MFPTEPCRVASIRLFIAVLFAVATASDVSSQQVARDLDEVLASRLSECDAALVAFDGLATLVEAPIDRDRLARARSIARRATIALVGLQSAREKYEASKTQIKAELSQALTLGTPAVQAFVQRHTERCAAVTEGNVEYLAKRIADERARRDAERN